MNYLDVLKAYLGDEGKRISSSSFLEKNNGFIVEYTTTCRAGCGDFILQKARDILLAINQNTLPKWPELDFWLAILPKYFTNSFSSDGGDWTFENWLYWFEPENRFWFLWSANAIDETHLKISILVHEHPFPSEALEVLFMKLGTDELEEVNICSCK